MKWLLNVLFIVFSTNAFAQPSINETQCLATAIYWETFQQTNEVSRQAVAWVLINRTKHNNFPKSICEVIKQPKQFPWRETWNIRDKRYYWIAYQTAFLVLEGSTSDPTKGALFFASKNDRWFNAMIRQGKLEKTQEIGGHKFYFWKSKK